MTIKELFEEMTSGNKPHFVVEGRNVKSVGHPELAAMANDGINIGDGMALFGCSRGPLFMANTETGLVKQLVDGNGSVVGFTDSDFDWERIGSMAERYSLSKMVTCYAGLGRYADFQGGVCCLSWMIYPDGRYFADEDGFGMEDNDEENIYCIIDRNMRVLVPFQPMTTTEILRWLREKRTT